VADPLGGSDYVEWMTDEMERQAEEVFAHLDDIGDGSILEGVYAGIEDGYFVGEIADAAYRFEREVNAGRRVIVGVNDFTEGDDEPTPLLRIEADTEDQQRKRLATVKAERDDAAVRRALEEVRRDAADATVNLMPSIIEAVRAYATEEEICHTIEGVFGTYTEPAIV
jgi:methylmalonyl-CoA mutase N-terminal domain/subunit